MCLRALTRPSCAMERFQPRRDKVDRSTVELVTVCVGNAHGISPREQLRTSDAKLAREAISLIDRDFCVFEDHAALVFEIFADDEIKIEVGHWNHLPSFNCTKTNVSRLVPSLQLYSSHPKFGRGCRNATRDQIS